MKPSGNNSSNGRNSTWPPEPTKKRNAIARPASKITRENRIASALPPIAAVTPKGWGQTMGLTPKGSDPSSSVFASALDLDQKRIALATARADGRQAEAAAVAAE